MEPIAMEGQMERENLAASMAGNSQKEGRTKAPALRGVGKRRRIWVVLVYAVVLFSWWSVLQHALPSCSKQQAQSSYYSLLLVGALGLLSLASVLALVVPATVVTWITVVVLLAFIGKSRRTLAAEGRKITKEIMVGFVVKVLLKEGNVLAAVCAVLGYLALGTINGD